MTIVFGLPEKMPSILETRIPSNSSPNYVVKKQSCCPSMLPEIKLVKSSNFGDAKEEEFPPCPNSFVQKQSAKKQSGKTFPRTLEILFKKAGQSKNPPSWKVLIGKQRRKNIKRIKQALENEKSINPFSVEQFQSFKNALEEHGHEETETPSATTPAVGEDNVQFLDNKEDVVFDFGCNYCDSEFDDLERQLKYNEFMKCFFQRNRAFDDSGFGNSIDLMELSSVEETLNGFLEEKLF